MSKQPFNPKSTVFLNLMLDEIMPAVSANAWKVLCLCMRKTQGWRDASSPTGRKIEDVISLSQFVKYCGFTEHTAISAINECISKGYLLRKQIGQSFSYWLNVNYEIDTSANFAEDIQPSSAIIAEVTSANFADTNNNLINNKEHSASSKNELARAKLSKDKHLEGTRKALENYYQRQENGQADFAWLDEGLVGLARAFVGAVGDQYIPTKSERSHWRKVLLEWQQIGITDDIITATVQKMKTQGLNIVGVQSITGMARSTMSISDLPPVFHADLGGLTEQEWYAKNYHK